MRPFGWVSGALNNHGGIAANCILQKSVQKHPPKLSKSGFILAQAVFRQPENYISLRGITFSLTPICRYIAPFCSRVSNTSQQTVSMARVSLKLPVYHGSGTWS